MSCERCSAGNGRTACFPTCCSPTTFPTSAARASGNRNGTRSRRTTSRRRASRSPRSRRSPRGASRRRCRRTLARRFSPRCSRSSSRITSGSTASAIPTTAGLVTLIHPWECGLDTTPPWMRALARMPSPWWARTATRLHLAHVVRFLRRDTKYVPSVQRPTDNEGLGMLVLARLAKRHGFELAPDAARSLGADPGPCVQLDPRGRQPIVDADRRGTRTNRCRRHCWIAFERTTVAIEELWDENTGEYFSRDAVDRRAHPDVDDRDVPAVVRWRAVTRTRRTVDRAASRTRVATGRGFRYRPFPPTRPSSARRRTGRARRG